jgi:hypothetical protein
LYGGQPITPGPLNKRCHLQCHRSTTLHTMTYVMNTPTPALHTSLTTLHLGSGDTVIHAPGFEDRTMAVADSIVSSVGARAILLDYLPFNPKNRLADVRFWR